jgi:hypothetical protein
MLQRSLLLAAALSAVAVSTHGTTYNVTFTWYGQGDYTGQSNCNSNSAACGFYTYVRPLGMNQKYLISEILPFCLKFHAQLLTISHQPGYSAAVSQNLYGAGPGEGSGPACGTCYRLLITGDPSGNPLRNAGGPIVVMVNNLCPAHDPRGYDNPLCAQRDLSGNSTNEYGGVVDFNLCSDDGARAALFGTSGVGLAVGTAEEVDCGEWSGTKRYDSGSAPAPGPPGPPPPPPQGGPTDGPGATSPPAATGTSGSGSGVIGGSDGDGNGAAEPQQGVGDGERLSMSSLWLLLIPLVIMIRL